MAIAKKDAKNKIMTFQIQKYSQIFLKIYFTISARNNCFIQFAPG